MTGIVTLCVSDYMSHAYINYLVCYMSVINMHVTCQETEYNIGDNVLQLIEPQKNTSGIGGASFNFINSIIGAGAIGKPLLLADGLLLHVCVCVCRYCFRYETGRFFSWTDPARVGGCGH